MRSKSNCLCMLFLSSRGYFFQISFIFTHFYSFQSPHSELLKMNFLSINYSHHFPQNEYSFQQPRRQLFGLPYDMMNSITYKNSNYIVYAKLISTCKHFFAKRPLLMVGNVHEDEVRQSYGLNTKYETVFWKFNIESKIKLWITGYFNSTYFDSTSAIANLIPMCYRFDGQDLQLVENELTLDEYIFLTSSKNLKYVRLYECNIKNDDGTYVCAKTLFEYIKHVESFD